MTCFRLGELFSAKRSVIDPRNFPDEEFALYSIPAYDSGFPAIVAGRHIGSAKQRLYENDVVLSRIVPHIRRAWVVTKSGDRRLLGSSEWITIEPGGNDPRYLRYALMSDSFHRQFMMTVGGVGGSLLRAQRDQVAQIELSLPSLREQRRAVELLDVFEKSIALEASATDLCRKLKYGVMRDMFTRGLRGESQKDSEIGPIPESWDIVRLGQLGRIGNGSTPKRDCAAYWDGGTFPWLTSAKVYDRSIVAADEFVTDLALQECHLPRVKPGAVLVAITGQGKTLGHCAVLQIEAAISQHLAYISVDPEIVDPNFLCSFLDTQYQSLRQVASGGGSTKGALTCAFLREFKVPMPSRAEQQEIQERLVAIDHKVSLHEKKRGVLRALFDAFLQALMSGTMAVPEHVGPPRSTNQIVLEYQSSSAP